MSTLVPRAILAGVAVDVLGSILAGSIVLALFAAATGASDVNALIASTEWLAASLVVGLAFSAVGGFVAAHLAPGAELNNAFVAGVLVTVLSAMLTAITEPVPPFWFTLVGVLATTPAATLGGWLRARTRPAPAPRS